MNVNFEIVYNVYLKIRSNIRNKNKIFYFELLLYSNINYIVKKINNNDYKLGNYNIFFIKDKKYRLILSNNIYDKIYNHLVSDFILSKLDKNLINSNVASRVNKGTKYGRYLINKYLIDIKKNNKIFYILKFDIKKYFFNINHDILLNKLSKYLNKEEILIVKNIIKCTNQSYINLNIKKINDKYKLNLPYYKIGYGLSIGSICSQMLAVFYLNDLDHFIKEKIGCKYYIRYMDDGIIFDSDKERLVSIFNKLKIEIKKLELEFNSKTKIYVSYEGFSFLGIKYLVKNNKIIKRISKKEKKIILKKININNYNFYKHYFSYVK